MHFENIPGERDARLVFGLEWRAYAIKGAAAERRRYAEEFDATHYIELKTKGETIGGFCAPDVTERKGLTLHSAAARVALLERVRSQPAVLVLIQNEQHVHLILVVRGAITADEEVALVALADRRDSIEDQCAKSGLQLVTLGYGAQLHDVDETFEVRELLAARKVGLIKRLPIKVPTVIPLLVIASAAFFGISKAIEVMNPPPPPPAPPPTFMQDYQAAVARTLAAPAPLASVLAPKLLAQFGKDESNSCGWQFSVATCSAAGYCSVAYKRQGGTFADFDSCAPASIRPIVFNADGSHLDTRGPDVGAVRRVALADQKTWPTRQALIKALQTDAQKLSVNSETLDSHGYKVDIKEPERLLARQPLPGEVQGPIVQRGDWTIDGYKWQSALLQRLPSSMALDSLKIELKEDGTGVHFTAKGKYYVLN
jgi:hypothetical protein